MESKRSTVGGIMSVEVVSQHAAKLFGALNVGASGNQVTTGKALIKVWIVSSVQLIDDHFPDRVATRRAPLSIAVALVGHPAVNFINVFLRAFFVQMSFLAAFLVTYQLDAKNSYEKRAQKMLMKLTPVVKRVRPDGNTT